MNPTTRRVLWLIAVLTLCLSTSGCWYATMFKPHVVQKVAFEDAAVPPGSAWSCFSSSNNGRLVNICERSREECSGTAENNRRLGATVSMCKQTPSASCYYEDFDPAQSGALIPIGDRRKLLGCFASAEECAEMQANHSENSQAGVVAISDCRTLH
jgi:hypothetical protein